MRYSIAAVRDGFCALALLKSIAQAFRGLPITLIYIGVLALAIYGFTGHSVIL